MQQPEKAASTRRRPGREWFKQWFDSPYYHILYQHHDEAEAEGFIDKLLAELRPAAGSRVLDLACGQGRYSRFLADKGFEVVGLDLSVNSIRYARRYERDNLSFFSHDMRLPYSVNYFDYAFNFFTSFGYFDQEEEEFKTLRNVAVALKPGGVFALDFFNSQYVIDRLPGRETKVIDGIRFDLHKEIEGDRVIKEIRFEDGGRSWFFRERVRLFRPADFDRLFGRAGLRITRRYGDYRLNPFAERESPRLILVARKDD